MIKLAYNAATSSYDISASGGIVNDEGLSTAILLSLLTNAGVGVDGWWGAQYSRIGAPWGSSLFLLLRGPRTSDIATKAQDAARLALAWLIEYGYARDVSVVASLEGGQITLGVSITPARLTTTERVWEITINGL